MRKSRNPDTTDRRVDPVDTKRIDLISPATDALAGCIVDGATVGGGGSAKPASAHREAHA